ncbi:MAG: radical SAM protein [Desulfonatronovibrio sp. MSAO_Bac4]|nr:MAG: radical SAM protein [Desulfonatronovibrio sp. MSAO_Bac4]
MTKPPSYIDSLRNGLLNDKIKQAEEISLSCTLCPRKCAVNRLEDEKGFCNTGRNAQVASYTLHFGEERPLVGQGGSGTVFFAHCNLGCAFCQNYDISCSSWDFDQYAPHELAEIFLELQNKGAENINLVTPSHVILPILQAILIAAQKGLRIPLVYNTSSYDELNSLKLFQGIVDIYLADTKFFHSQYAGKYAQASDYPEKAKQAILEMHRQVGSLTLDDKGRAYKGLMIRHLVMPRGLAGSEMWLEYIAQNLPADTYINIMNQYHPAGKASKFPELMKKVPGSVVEELKQKARFLGLNRLDKRKTILF